MPTEQQLYTENSYFYDSNAVCKDLEPNFTAIFRKLQDGEISLNENGQLVRKVDGFVLAGFFTVPLFWSLESRMLGIETTLPFESIVLIKNPGRMNAEPYQDAGVGAVNGLVMVGDTLWCAAIQPGSNFMKLVRRATDLVGGGKDFQHELVAQFTSLIEKKELTISPWNPVPWILRGQVNLR